MSHVDDAHNATHPPRNVASTDPDEGSLQYSSSGVPVPPTAHTHSTTRSHHGHDVVDNYEWLRDKESPETLAYLRAENEYTEARTRDLAPLQDSIFHEIKSRTQETDLSVPVGGLVVLRPQPRGEELRGIVSHSGVLNGGQNEGLDSAGN